MPGESRGRRNLEGSSPGGRKESVTTEHPRPFPFCENVDTESEVARGRRKGESNLNVEKVIAFADIITNKNQKRVDLTTILLCQQFYLLTKNRASVKERCIHTLSLIGAHGLWVFDESIC